MSASRKMTGIIFISPLKFEPDLFVVAAVSFLFRHKYQHKFLYFEFRCCHWVDFQFLVGFLFRFRILDQAIQLPHNWKKKYNKWKEKKSQANWWRPIDAHFPPNLDFWGQIRHFRSTFLRILLGDWRHFPWKAKLGDARDAREAEGFSGDSRESQGGAELALLTVSEKSPWGDQWGAGVRHLAPRRRPMAFAHRSVTSSPAHTSPSARWRGHPLLPPLHPKFQ